MSHVVEYEVRVVVEEKAMPHYSVHVSGRVRSTVTKMFHIFARTGQQACDKAWKYGRPIGVRKINREKVAGDIDNLRLEPQIIDVYKNGNPYRSALAMDEFMWQKRNSRRKNMTEKDKNPLDK